MTQDAESSWSRAESSRGNTSPGHVIPLCGVSIRWSAGCHCSDCVLNLGVKSSLELYDYGFWVCVARVDYQVLELINVVV